MGHAQHTCKACMSKKNKGDETDPYVPVVDDEFDELFCNMQYDIFNSVIDILTPIEPENKRYDKLSKEEKAALKELWADIVIRY